MYELTVVIHELTLVIAIMTGVLIGGFALLNRRLKEVRDGIRGR